MCSRISFFLFSFLIYSLKFHNNIGSICKFMTTQPLCPKSLTSLLSIRIPSNLTASHSSAIRHERKLTGSLRFLAFPLLHRSSSIPPQLPRPSLLPRSRSPPVQNGSSLSLFVRIMLSLICYCNLRKWLGGSNRRPW